MPKRRANGDGNIRKRKDGRWEDRYTVGHDPETGSIPLAELTSLDLRRFYKHLLEGGRVDRIEAKKKQKGLAPKAARCQRWSTRR